MKESRVYLIGVGPGDPSLISVRGYRYLQSADVIVYDHLVHRRLLRSVRADAERIDVGAAAPRPLEQDAICFLLAEKAREGKTVARLKWGDPFVFDSGGKEALFLHEQGIPFEVVPGVPPAIGAACYAGVPVTYPEAGDVLVLIRGHERESSDPPHVNWTRLATLDGTIVTYADGTQVEHVLTSLITHGRSPDEPATLIFDGTLPSQRTVSGTLGELLRLVKTQPPAQTGVLVAGRVTALREHLRWFDSRPLFGKRIVVTRSREQAGELVDLLADLGADPIEAPTIRIAPPESFAELDDACATLGSFDWVVFTSANGVDFFMQRLLAGPGDVRDFKDVRICAIGPATSDRLSRFGIKVDLMPVEFRAEAIVEALCQRIDLTGLRFLLPRADIARELLAVELRRAGSDVIEVTAYRTLPPHPSRDDVDIYKLLLERQVDVVTFTSASTVRNFVRLLGEEPAADLLRTVEVASIGPVTAEAAERLNIRTTIMPSSYTIPALVEAIVEFFERQNRSAERRQP